MSKWFVPIMYKGMGMRKGKCQSMLCWQYATLLEGVFLLKKYPRSFQKSEFLPILFKCNI